MPENIDAAFITVGRCGIDRRVVGTRFVVECAHPSAHNGLQQEGGSLINYWVVEIHVRASMRLLSKLVVYLSAVLAYRLCDKIG